MAVPVDMLAYLVGYEALQSSPDELDSWCLSRSDHDRKTVKLEAWGKRMIELLDMQGIEVKFK